ncbi:MAG: DivIVA domain-containing protein [Nitrospiraceae bacterium]|nr:DivIVA domain-containing protein [Nitrospiraceae bacterium]
MKITPLDIQQKQFPVKFRGFDADEVYAFMELVREQMEELMRENSHGKETISRLEAQMKEYKGMEAALTETLMTARQMADDHRNNARKEAELILREAEIKAEEMLRDAQERVVKIHEDIVDLKGIRRHFKEEMKRLIENHLRLIEFDKEREGEGEEAAVESSDFLDEKPGRQMDEQ